MNLLLYIAYVDHSVQQPCERAISVPVLPSLPMNFSLRYTAFVQPYERRPDSRLHTIDVKPPSVTRYLPVNATRISLPLPLCRWSNKTLNKSPQQAGQKDSQVLQQCTNCTFANPELSVECQMCGEPLPYGRARRNQSVRRTRAWYCTVDSNALRSLR